MSDCPRLGRLNGCKFEPRYDTVSAVTPTFDAIFFSGVGAQPKSTPERKTYVHDICVRCGKVVKREPKPA